VNKAIPVRRLNHLVLKVRDLDRSVTFYRRLLGFTEPLARYEGTMAFLRLPDSTNHHDLALMQVGDDAQEAPKAGVGLLHFAFEVQDIRELAAAREQLIAEGLFDREFDHGATKSVYGNDPDGHNFEIMWMVRRDEWGEWATRAPERLPLNLASEVAAG
jgi:catechol-2,3-dioxygenase